MTPEAMRSAVAESEGQLDRWVIVKRGLYYRPNGHGYTGNIQEAWIVSEKEADEHVYPVGEEPVMKQRAPLRDYLDLNAILPLLLPLQPIWIHYEDGEWFMDKTRGGKAIHNKSLALAACEFYLKWKGKWLE